MPTVKDIHSHGNLKMMSSLKFLLYLFIYLLHFLDNPVYHFYQYAHIHLHETTAYTINSSLEQNTHKKSQFGIEVNYREDNCLC